MQQWCESEGVSSVNLKLNMFSLKDYCIDGKYPFVDTNKRSTRDRKETHSSTGHKANKDLCRFWSCAFRKPLQWQSLTALCSLQDLLLCVQTAAACCHHDAPLPTVLWNQCSEWQIYFNSAFGCLSFSLWTWIVMIVTLMACFGFLVRACVHSSKWVING